jgi:hypothetical protein
MTGSGYIDKFAELVSKSSKLKMMHHMLGLQSTKRGLDWEHKEIERDSQTMRNALSGQPTTTPAPGMENDGMGNMIMADRVEYGTVHGQQPKNNLTQLLMAAIAGIGGTMAYQNATKPEPEPPPVVEPADPSLNVSVTNPE